MYAGLTSIVAALVLIAWILVGTAAAQIAPVNLGTASSFAVLGGAGVTNTGETVVSGDLGACPIPAITGFPPGTVINGVVHAGDAVCLEAQEDMTTAYNDAAGRPCTQTLSPELGGLTLSEGVYCFTSEAQLTGTLTLVGGPDDVFIFKVGSQLTTASASRVALEGVDPCNVFWVVGSTAVLGSNSVFVGTIIAQAAINVGEGASVEGRLLARTESVTLINNDIIRPLCEPTPSPTPSPTASPTPSPTASPTPSPTASPTPSPTASPTPSPTASPTPSPTPFPTPPPGAAPTIAVIKDASPLSRPEPGGTFTFRVAVLNSGSESVAITSLVDDVYGNLNGRGSCSTGAVVPPGNTYVCQFDGNFTGVSGASQTDIVTAQVVDSEGTVSTAQDAATVFITARGADVIIPRAGTPLLAPDQGAGVLTAPKEAGRRALARTGMDALAMTALAAALIVLGWLLESSTPAFEGSRPAAWRRQKRRRYR